MSRLLRNWRLKAIAVFFATTTWGVVAYAGNPVVSHDFHGVPISSPTPPNNWVMLSQLPAVTVTVSGLKQNLDLFQVASLHASVDLSGARLASNVVKVNVDNADPHVTVVSVQPSYVEVVLDEKDTVTKKVDPRQKNSPNNCCVAQNSKATVNPDSVRLSGPRSLVAKAIPYVQADLSEARGDVVQTLDVKLDGIDPKLAGLVTIEPKQATETVPVTLVKKQKSAGVHVVDVGQVASGYVLGDVRYAPDIIVIEGDPSVIDSVTSIDTDPISINGATSDVVRTVTLRPPPGITVVGNVTVRVTISVNPAPQPTPSPGPSASPSSRPGG